MASTFDEIMRQSKETIARAYEGAINQINRKDARARGERERREFAVEVTSKLVGAGLVGPLSAMGTGYLEARVPAVNKLRMGPVTFPAFVGFAALAGSYAVRENSLAANQLSHVASANFGLAAGTFGRACGAADRAASLAAKAGGRPPQVAGIPHATAQAEADALGVGFDDSTAFAEEVGTAEMLEELSVGEKVALNVV